MTTTDAPTTGTGQDWLDKIRKLLAKAEKAGTPEEAELFSAKAQELMLKHSIDAALLGQKPESSDVVTSRRFEVKFYPKPKVSLLAGIASAFGCQAVYYPSSRGRGAIVVMVYGWQSDLEMVEVLYASLDIQANREAEGRWHVEYHRTLGHPEHALLHGKAFKTSFYVGFAQTVTRRLADQRQGAVQEAEDSMPGTALVLVDRSRAVTREFQRANPRTKTGTGSSVSSHSGYYSGRDAGNRADLGSGPRLGATGRKGIGPATR